MKEENDNIEERMKALEIENERLEKENDLKLGWISLISHDFKEAFSSILLLLEAFENKSISQADFFALLPQLKQDAKKNLKTVTKTATWIKAQNNAFEPQLTEVYAFDLFANLKEEFKDRLRDKQLSFFYDGEEGLTLKTDQLLTSFIFKQILDNAIKYSPRDGSIWFKATPSEKHIILSIKDKGIGMAEKQVENVFSFNAPIFRGTQGEVGAGLSLKIVKNFVYLMQGELELKSLENKGTTVSVFLPQK